MRYSSFQDLLFGVVVGGDSFTTFNVVVDEFDDGWITVVENFLGEGAKVYGVESFAHVKGNKDGSEGWLVFIEAFGNDIYDAVKG